MNSLIGVWMYASLIYNGNPLQRPDERLKMYLIFENNSINEILYSREDENGFCRRKAEYEAVNNVLLQKVIEVDPENASHCSQDSRTNFEVKEDKLYLHLPLGEETITYVWEKK